MPKFLRGLLAIACLFGGVSAAHADDWEVVKLRGSVLQLIDGAWQPLERGDIVPDNRVLRTLSFGRAELTRGGETVALGPNTQIQIYDEHRARPFTTVVQSFGSVAVEANVENVQHFAVQTPYLAAVVKGTRFVVTSGKAGASVKVERGHVAVTDYASRDQVLIAAGQSAKIDRDAADEIVVSGAGELPQVVKARGGSAAANGAANKHSGGTNSGAPAGAPSNEHSDDRAGEDGDGSGKGQAGTGNDDSSGKGQSGKGEESSGRSGTENSGSNEGTSGSGKSGGSWSAFGASSGTSASGNSGHGKSGDSSEED